MRSCVETSSEHEWAKLIPNPRSQLENYLAECVIAMSLIEASISTNPIQLAVKPAARTSDNSLASFTRFRQHRRLRNPLLAALQPPLTGCLTCSRFCSFESTEKRWISIAINKKPVIHSIKNSYELRDSINFNNRRNVGYLLIGELDGGDSDRAERVRRWLSRGVEVKVTPNLQGAVWSKLLLNCSVTTIGAIAGQTMREYIDRPEGRELFYCAYGEALSVALASGVRPERMLVDPIPPGWNGRSTSGEAHDPWLVEILSAYGGARASMLQDFERGRTTEIDFINGYVVDTARQFGLDTPINPNLLGQILQTSR